MEMNQKKDNIYLGDEARAALMRGVDKVADAVKGTLGAGGYNALIEDPRPPFTVATNDGVSVARSITLADSVEQMGARLMQEIGAKSDKDGGDGTTTSITLAQAILHQGLKWNASPMEIKRSLEASLPVILQSIDDQTKEITVSEVGQVATISAEDGQLGALIQEIYERIGADGILYTDISKTAYDYYTEGVGVKVDGAILASPYMADVDSGGKFDKSITLKKPKILVTKQRISSALELNDIVTSLYNAGTKELVIICDDVDASVIPDLIMTRAKSGFRFVLIKMPVLWKDQWFEDIAKMTGATIVDPTLGIGFKEFKSSYFGTCGSILADKNETCLDGILDISDYISGLVAEGTDDSLVRAARLNTKTARLFVGASSDSALSYKRLKVEDARNAAYQALHGGVVAGGGIALYNAIMKLKDGELGTHILAEALAAPFFQIVRNAGADPEEIAQQLKYSENYSSIGFNAKTGEMVDMFEAGIIDPAKIVKNAITNAISVAATVLTTRVIVTLPAREEIQTPLI